MSELFDSVFKSFSVKKKQNEVKFYFKNIINNDNKFICFMSRDLEKIKL